MVPKFLVVRGLARQADWNNAEEVEVEDSEGFMEIISEICERFPGRPAYDICKSYFRSVCPLSLTDEITDEMTRMEARTERYGDRFLSYEGPIPLYVEEAFDAIATGRNQYYRDRDEKARSAEKQAAVRRQR